MDGIQNDMSGVLLVQMDDDEPFTTNLWSQNSTCGLFFQYNVNNGTHTLTMTLLQADEFESGSDQPVVHFTDITYVLVHL